MKDNNIFDLDMPPEDIIKVQRAKVNSNTKKFMKNKESANTKSIKNVRITSASNKRINVHKSLLDSHNETTMRKLANNISSHEIHNKTKPKRISKDFGGIPDTP